MRRAVVIALSVVVILALMSTPLLSATVDDLAGTWATRSVAKLKRSVELVQDHPKMLQQGRTPIRVFGVLSRMARRCLSPWILMAVMS